ncbi:DsbE family thiol:disulfide interchange protein [Neisseria iguanae]|uniref:DsbE family thiol:disulfide interchange protein n=1 Tax=Neisseria iguanae TaxID=90242 RepID=A0A2P7U0H1_9NEIS|nr:DsbE family thiol:disulfide interchange protein [Neisseria iguanae]PSJ80441.1 DsbE family thiol:disulfide interchange protein [Neisseria iguanae]
MRKIIRVWPLFLLVGVLGLFFLGLQNDPRKLPSTLINNPLPAFSLPTLQNAAKEMDSKNYLGQVWLLNVWASWCVTCRQEHGFLLALEQNKTIPIVGLNYKDDPIAARWWLREMGGDPYQVSVVDRGGKIGIELGVYGVPETFLIDKKGHVIHRFTGALNNGVFQKEFQPLINKAMQE